MGGVVPSDAEVVPQRLEVFSAARVRREYRARREDSGRREGMAAVETDGRRQQLDRRRRFLVFGG